MRRLAFLTVLAIGGLTLSASQADAQFYSGSRTVTRTTNTNFGRPLATSGSTLLYSAAPTTLTTFQTQPAFSYATAPALTTFQAQPVTFAAAPVMTYQVQPVFTVPMATTWVQAQPLALATPTTTVTLAAAPTATVTTVLIPKHSWLRHR